MWGRLIDDFSSHIRVTCLTSNGVNSMPMWAHYANNHKGFCVEYDMRDRENLKLTSTTFPVQYTNKRVDITDLMDYQSKKIIGTIESHIALGKKEIIYNDLTLVFMESFFNNIKHETWSYENEYRCIVGTNISGMPYYDAVPKAIYIGINCEEYYKNQLMDIAKKININVFSMVLNEYSLDFNLSSQKVSTTR